jgi:hypothetical protein
MKTGRRTLVPLITRMCGADLAGFMITFSVALGGADMHATAA